MKHSVIELTVCAALSAILCVVCPFTVPVGVVPLSLASFAVCCIGGAAGFKRGTAATALYILIGGVGVPVFAGFRGGLSVLLGPTGGFLLGYLLLVATAGFAADRTDSKCTFCASLCGGMLLLYLCGSAWYSVSAHVSFWAALLVCVVPFLPLDIVKIAAATALSPKLKKALRSMKT